MLAEKREFKLSWQLNLTLGRTREVSTPTVVQGGVDGTTP